MSKNIFVTGGGGFIAPHLLDCLDPAWSVTVHVRNPLKIENIKPRPGLRIISGPLTERSLLSQVPEQCETVIHLAGAVQGPNVEAILESNIVSTHNVLALMHARRIPRLIFMSTAAVWADSAGIRLSEQTEPSPSTLYGYAKLSAECLVKDAILQGQLSSAAVLRCNNTYGRGSIQGVVANFKACLLNRQPVRIDGDGQQLREPLYVSDLVDVIVKACSLDQGLHVYGISGPEPLTILQMAEIMARVLGRDLDVDWQPDRSDRSRHLLINTEKARQELGWHPRVHFEEGVRLLCANCP